MEACGSKKIGFERLLFNESQGLHGISPDSAALGATKGTVASAP